MFVEAIEDLLRGHGDAAQVRAIDAGGSCEALWQALEEAGFLALLAPEALGGAGLDRAGFFPVLLACGRHVAPVPVAQSMLAHALLVPHDVAVPAGRVTLASGALLRAADGSLRCERVPHGMQAGHVLVNDQGALLLLDAGLAERQSTGVAGSLQATLLWSADVAGKAQRARLPNAGAALRMQGAAMHAALLAGAMEAVLDMSLRHANDRVQFGKSIGKFQAIQHQLSVMAEHVAAARVAAELAFNGPELTLELAAVAKARCSEAASVVAGIAHAVHGAIGVTVEFDLQLYTRRLHEWRMADGSEAYWQAELGRLLLADAGKPLAVFTRELSALG